MSKLIKIFTVGLMLVSSHVNAGALIQDATIVSLNSVSGNLNTFAVLTEGGSGTCVGTSIQFPVEESVNADGHKRSFSLASLALSTGMKISAYSYVNKTNPLDECKTAGQIRVYK